MQTFYGKSAKAALLIAHCAGMIDLVALPVWVGTLMGSYGLSAAQAGGLASTFLVAAVVVSMLVARQLQRLPAKRMAGLGYAVAAAAFAAASQTQSYPVLALLHATAGTGVALGLSLVHAAIGRSDRPHRLFAWAGLALGVFATVFLGGAPVLIQQFGPATLFVLFAAVMLAAALACWLCFPQTQRPAQEHTQAQSTQPAAALPRLAYLCAGGIACMALIQAIVFSFMERIGVSHGLDTAGISAVLIAMGLVNLLPAPLAAWLERRWSARHVLWAGPVLQGLLAVLLTASPWIPAYVAAAMGFAAVLIFTHTFAFGWLTRLDPSGRMVAATPAMLMAGSAVGPILGGLVVSWQGYAALGVVAVAIECVAIALFLQSTEPNRVALADSANGAVKPV